jgi:hypothetical protein
MPSKERHSQGHSHMSGGVPETCIVVSLTIKASFDGAPELTKSTSIPLGVSSCFSSS